MRYALAILTSKRRDPTVQRAVDSFLANVRPRPTEFLVVADGRQSVIPSVVDSPHGGVHPVEWHVETSSRQRGFCKATGSLWRLARRRGLPYTFWLEDDFVITRGVNLIDIAHVLDSEPTLTQMALLRQPVNEVEHQYGGYMKVHPDAYERRGSGGVVWWQHRHHWTTNPSLIPARTLSYEWPAGEEYCEGKYGIALASQGRTFGIWGAGDPWCEHIGQREGSGY